MKHTQNSTAPSSRLRVVFDDAVVMFKLAKGATYGDIAALWDDAALGHDGTTIAIAVTIDPSLPLPAHWLFPSMSGAAMCGAPSLRYPPIHDYFVRPDAGQNSRPFA